MIRLIITAEHVDDDGNLKTTTDIFHVDENHKYFKIFLIEQMILLITNKKL